MRFDWNSKLEQERFMYIWKNRPQSSIGHTALDWDQRADVWNRELRKNPTRKARSARRVQATADYLRMHGLLTSSDTVIDIGCGPGRFVTEFASTSQYVMGLDISERMIWHAADYAAAMGKNNCSFSVCDFHETDLDKNGWRNHFDLVFSSITPAMSTPEDLDKMEAMSRGFYFSSMFVRAIDPLSDAALAEVFPGVEERNPSNGRTFYAAYNLLWLRGRFPEISYYKEQDEELLPADYELAQRILQRMPDALVTEAALDQIYRYLMKHADSNGMVTYPSERWYGWLLWDVRDFVSRNYY